MEQAKPFLKKLYTMVEDTDTNDTVAWTQDGTALQVLDPEHFVQNLLPRYFNHNNFSSFVRQLNTYGFNKIAEKEWRFAHTHFQRGKEHQLRFVQRKSSHRVATPAADQQSVAVVVAPAVAGDHAQGLAAGGADGSKLAAGAAGISAAADAASEAAMRAELRAIRKTHAAMASRLQDLNSQVAATKEAQGTTRNSITKIMTFLSQVYQAHHNGVNPLDAAAHSPGAGGAGGIASLGEMVSAVAHPVVELTPAAKRPRLEDSSQASLVDSSPSAPPTFPVVPAEVSRQPSLGETAALALPNDLQDVALELVGSTMLQDAALTRVKSDMRIENDSDAANMELESFLWDFLEANQENVEQREQELNGAPAPA